MRLRRGTRGSSAVVEVVAVGEERRREGLFGQNREWPRGRSRRWKSLLRVWRMGRGDGGVRFLAKAVEAKSAFLLLLLPSLRHEVDWASVA